ncbi:MAG: DUF177 domain-containing protein [Bacteroidota bacterium]
MTQLKELAIDIPRQGSASSETIYRLDGAFFQLFETSLLEKGQLDVRIQLNKNSSRIQLLFEIKGEVELVCDRTLEQFNYPVCIEQVVHFRLGDENKELDVDCYMIEQKATAINVAQHIYDFVTLAVPMKKLHPRFVTEV